MRPRFYFDELGLVRENKEDIVLTVECSDGLLRTFILTWGLIDFDGDKIDRWTIRWWEFEDRQVCTFLTTFATSKEAVDYLENWAAGGMPSSPK